MIKNDESQDKLIEQILNQLRTQIQNNYSGTGPKLSIKQSTRTQLGQNPNLDSECNEKLKSNLTEEELKKAYFFWLRHYKFEENDKDLLPYLSDKMPPYKLKQLSWIRKARESLFLSTITVAEKMKVSKNQFLKYELNEENGTISLNNLAKVAAAMDCELIYAIRPKNRKLFSVNIWNKLLAISLKHPWIKKCDQRKRSQALVYIANNFLKKPEFRRDQGWSQRAN